MKHLYVVCWLALLVLVGCSVDLVRESDPVARDAEKLVQAVGNLHAERENATLGGQVAFSCTYCHGRYGDNQSDYYPKLAGLPAKYIKDQLLAYGQGRRHSLSMQSMALALSTDEMDLVADFFASREPNLENVFLADEAQVADGRTKAATCVVCHGPGARVDPNTPRLAGQGYAYLVAQLTAYRDGGRVDANPTMPALVAGLTDADIRAIAQYYAAQ